MVVENLTLTKNKIMLDINSIIIAIIAAIPPTLVGLLVFYSSRKNARAIEDVHISINSRMDQLLESSKGEAKAQGVVQGRAEEKNSK